jgi:hypothetical protein
VMIPIIVPVALAIVVGAGVYRTASKGARAAKRRLSAASEKEKSAALSGSESASDSGPASRREPKLPRVDPA